MKSMECDVVVIGGGPAGLAAAIGAYDNGAENVVILERDKYLGGILQQCIHNGFGLHAFGEDLSGPEYAERFIVEVAKRKIKCLTKTMVLSLSEGREIIAAQSGEGIIRINAKAVVLAMGCRERTRGAIALPGERPAGVFTAGTAQRLINMEGYLPGREIVILGSGDIGMIMARRLHLEGAKVKAVVEIMPSVGGLNRNLVQCLQDFDIPLYLNHSITDIEGTERVESVCVAPLVDGQPQREKEFTVACDTLLLSVGLIPENELSKQAGIELAPATNGPLVDQYFQTSVPGIFAAGNVVLVFDLVDYVSECGNKAGASAARFAAGEIGSWNADSARVSFDDSIRCLIPQRLTPGQTDEEVTFFMRAANTFRQATLQLHGPSDEVIFEKRIAIARPPEMITAKVADFKPVDKSVYSFQLRGKV